MSNKNCPRTIPWHLKTVKAGYDHYIDLERSKFKSIENGSANTSFTCGGSLINYRYVLTSAHCIRPAGVVGYDSNVFSVVLRNGEQIEIENVTIHFNYTRQVDEIEKYNDLLVAAQQNATISTAEEYSEEWSEVEDKGPYFKYSYRPFDIALIRLKQAVDLKIQRPICLPYKRIYGIQNSTVFETKKATLFSAGWGGYLGPDYTEPSKELNYLHLPIINNTFCQRMFRKTIIRNEMICTGGVKGQDLCIGDSGGPLFISVEGRSFQVGVSSFGNDPCANSQDTEDGTMNSLSVFLNVSRYLPWILDNMWP